VDDSGTSTDNMETIWQELCLSVTDSPLTRTESILVQLCFTYKEGFHMFVGLIQTFLAVTRGISLLCPCPTEADQRSQTVLPLLQLSEQQDSSQVPNPCWQPLLMELTPGGIVALSPLGKDNRRSSFPSSPPALVPPGEFPVRLLAPPSPGDPH
jgi:hypothetical protein